MTDRIRDQLTGLAAAMADLRERVRVAVADELARAVSGAVQEVVQAAVAGRAGPPRPEPRPVYRPSPAPRWEDDGDDGWGRPREPWVDGPEDDGYNRNLPTRHAPPVRPDDGPTDDPLAPPAVTTAVAAGVYAARWWLLRRGTLFAATGLGIVVGLLGLFAGPAVRAAVAVLAAAGDVLSAADALGGGAARLDHP